MGSQEALFLFALASTVFIETIALFLVLRRIFRIPSKKIRAQEIIIAGVLASSLTLPYLWFVLPGFLKTYYVYLAIGEIGVALAEGAFYGYFLKIGFKRGLIASAICNFASAALWMAFIRSYLQAWFPAFCS